MKEHIAQHTVPARTRASATPATSRVTTTSTGQRGVTASRQTEPHAYGLTPVARTPQANQQTIRRQQQVDEDNVDDFTPPPMHTATIRHRPIAPTGMQRYTSPPAAPPPPKTRGGIHPLFIIGLIFFCLIVGVMAATYIPPLVQKWNNDRAYGYPRTYQTTTNVGHGGNSHFIALNNNGVLEVIEIPTAADQAHLYILGTLAGPGADLAPITLSFQDVNGDGKPDLLAVCNQTQYTLYNTGKAFSSKP